MKKNLIVITNEKFYNDENFFYCEHVAEKTIHDGLINDFDVKIVGRKSKTKGHHKLENKNIKSYSSLIPYLYEIYKKILNTDTKFLILAISPYTFFASLLFIFSSKKPIVYLRSDGHQEYRSILGFYGPIIYGAMFNIVSLNCIFISCRKYILRQKFGYTVYPSELTDTWKKNIIKPNLEKIKLLYVGRMKVEKGIFSLIDLIKEAKNDINLTIVGEDSPQRKKLYHEKINFLPTKNNTNDLINCYDEHNIFILPSFTEGHPMVLLESLARRRPVIIFEDISHVAQNKKGVFVAKRNLKSLNETILFIKNNYLKIYEEMKLNNLPTKDQFLISFRDIISKIQ